MRIKKIDGKLVIVDDGSDRTVLETEDGEIELEELDDLVREIWRNIMEKYTESQKS